MSHAIRVGNATICYEPMREIKRVSEGERWCFVCRKRREFFFVITAPKDTNSYYGPNPSVQCSLCKTSDGDCFPGRNREWEF